MSGGGFGGSSGFSSSSGFSGGSGFGGGSGFEEGGQMQMSSSGEVPLHRCTLERCFYLNR